MSSQLLSHGPCSSCNSSDGCATYDDGHTHCFVCEAHTSGSGKAEAKKPARSSSFLDVTPVDLPKRGITESVCRSNGYGISTIRGETVQVAEYRDRNGATVAQKVRTAAKDFHIIGDAKGMTLWPMHRFPKGGKRLLICEGELDLLCWQTLAGDRWPAVSVPNGASAAARDVAKAIDWVESFDEVVLCFDADDAGRAANLAVCEKLSPGKVHVMRLPGGAKDICDAVSKGLSKDLVDAFWKAGPWRPDGVVGSAEILEALMKPLPRSTPYPWEGLNKKLLGMRPGELVTLTAGTGIGKSLVAGAIAHSLIKSGSKVGYISLEESLARTAERLLNAEMLRPLHLTREGTSVQEISAVWNEVFGGRVCIFNHFGSMDAETLLQRVRFMRIAEGVDFIVIDHLSILVSGWDSDDGDERRLIDNIMTTLRSICAQTGVGMLLISHLRAPDSRGKTHEEGGRPKLTELRGSKSISQLSDAVIALARDQQGDDPHRSEVYVLKNRLTGDCGLAGHLIYSPETGTLREADATAADHGF